MCCGHECPTPVNEKLFTQFTLKSSWSEETDNMTESYGITAKSTVEIEDFTHEIEEEDVRPEWVPPVEFKSETFK